MSAAPESDSSKKKKFMDCLSCRVMSFCALSLSAAYIIFAARKQIKTRGPSMGAGMQITFALGLASMGVVILNDPVGKMERKA